MDFDNPAQWAEGLYQEWLASGRQDEIALRHGIRAAYQALETLPPDRLTPAQQRQWDNLAGIYEECAPAGRTWHPEHRQGWFEEVRELLREVQP